MEITENNIDSLTDEQLEAAFNLRKQQKAEQQKKQREAYENTRNDIVNMCTTAALLIEESLVGLHKQTFADLIAFRELKQEYGDLPKNSKGGFTITNDEGTMKITLKQRNLGDYDERADLAEEHIRGFFERTLKAADPNTFEILMSLLERKKGKLEYSRVMQILSFEDRYDDPDWKTACKLLKESYNHTGTKWYIEFNVKEDDSWRPLNLNIASL